MVVQEYSHGEELQILNLFRSVYKKEMGIEFWRWRYVNNPFGKGIIRLMYDNDFLVGHYGVVPLQLRISGSEVKAALSMTTMVHPDYQGRGIFPKLALETYEQCEREGVKVVFGFPNENSYSGFIRKLGWFGFGKIKAWQLSYSAETAYAGSTTAYNGSTYIVEEIADFDSSFDQLWEKASQDYEFIVPRTSGYLNWRYFQKPGNEYHVVAFKGSSGELDGYGVYKIYQDKEEKKGHIIDLLFANEQGIPEAIVDYGLSYFAKGKVDTVSCWIPEICGMEDIMLKKGFKRIEWNCYFGLKYFDDNMNQRAITDYRDLYITMGDSDVF